MKVQIEQADGAFILEEREPNCGEDFCDRCGDCLACSDETCWNGGRDNGSHRWVIYVD